MEITIKIDLGKIKQNLLSYGKPTILMVKGDAYGHGIEQVARATADIVQGFGVATVEEGKAVREICPNAPILVAQWCPGEIDEGKSNDLTLSTSTLQQLELVKAEGAKHAVKLNSGMNRFGFGIEDIPALKAKLKDDNPREIYSHLYSSQSAPSQTQCFYEMVSSLGLNAPTHLCSSAYAHLAQDSIRVGIGAYKDAMTVTSKVVAVRTLKKGDNVGYGMTMSRSGNLAWVFGGYADGINWQNPSPVLLGGRLCQTVAVCMDTFAVFTADYVPKIFEDVTLQNHVLTAERIAKYTSTSPYVVMTGWHGRVQRIYQC